MSLYSFSASSFTTSADRRRRPAIDKGQIVRTLAFFVAALLALVVVSQHRAHAVDLGEQALRLDA